MGIEIIRESAPHTVIEIITKLMELDRQISLTKDNNEWVISYTKGSSHSPVDESPGAA